MESQTSFRCRWGLALVPLLAQGRSLSLCHPDSVQLWGQGAGAETAGHSPK